MYASAEKIATVGHQQNNSELTKPQMPVLKSMREQGNCTFLLECEDPNYVVREIFPKYLNRSYLSKINIFNSQRYAAF